MVGTETNPNWYKAWPGRTVPVRHRHIPIATEHIGMAAHRPSFRQALTLAALALFLTCSALPAHSQVLSEQSLGSIVPQGPPAGAPVISPRGDQFAWRERSGAQERYVTLQSPGDLFDRILPGAVWINNRLVYFATQAGQTLLIDGAKRILLKGTPTSPVIAGRPWTSADGQHYVAFVSDGKSVGWYADGVLQKTRFSRLANVPIVPPSAVPMFVSLTACIMAVNGHAPSSKMRWDLLRWVHSSPDGGIVFAHGERAGRALLHRNGVEVLREALYSFSASVDGRHWMASVDRSMDGAPRTELLRDGQPVASADVEPSRQELFLSADGTRWAWKILDEDYIAATLRQPGLPDQRLPRDALEFALSHDGTHQAYIALTTDTPPRPEVFIDGKPLASYAEIRGRSLQLGPDGAYAFVASENSKQKVVSHLGVGVTFDDVSAIQFLADGRPIYGATNIAERFVVIGDKVLKVPANDLHWHTLRVEGPTVRVLGARGTEIIQFSITVN